MQKGTLRAIAVREKSRAPMVEESAAQVTLQGGVVGDFRGKPGARQVTVLSQESWEAACRQLGRQLPWTDRRANLLISGIELSDSSSRRLQIGEVTLEITAETEPCQRMEETSPGLLIALTPAWRGGVCCRVLTPGTISLGDIVTMAD